MSTSQELEAVHVSPKIVEYLDAIVAATHSPARAGLQRLEAILTSGALPEDRERILRSAKERALHASRAYVVPEDVRAAALDALSLTLELADNPTARDLGAEGAVRALLDWVDIP